MKDKSGISSIELPPPSDLDEETALRQVIIPWMETMLAQARERLRQLERAESKRSQ